MKKYTTRDWVLGMFFLAFMALAIVLIWDFNWIWMKLQGTIFIIMIVYGLATMPEDTIKPKQEYRNTFQSKLEQKMREQSKKRS